ncbi:hypothetical protein C8R44DRAFT_750813 [Mycena epipterygia]|nr:hypothetical protein C8R44DRAFT_750813 [Mycena epipterygia]
MRAELPHGGELGLSRLAWTWGRWLGRRGQLGARGGGRTSRRWGEGGMGPLDRVGCFMDAKGQQRVPDEETPFVNPNFNKGGYVWSRDRSARRRPYKQSTTTPRQSHSGSHSQRLINEQIQIENETRMSTNYLTSTFNFENQLKNEGHGIVARDGAGCAAGRLIMILTGKIPKDLAHRLDQCYILQLFMTAGNPFEVFWPLRLAVVSSSTSMCYFSAYDLRMTDNIWRPHTWPTSVSATDDKPSCWHSAVLFLR